MEILQAVRLQTASIRIETVGIVKNNVCLEENRNEHTRGHSRRYQGDGQGSVAKGLSIDRVRHAKRCISIGAGRRQDRIAIDREMHMDQILVPSVCGVLSGSVE